MKFYDRKKEIGTMKNLKGDFRIAVVGRRRIGKTRLVEEVFRKNRITLFISAEKSEKEIINDWADEYEEIPRVSTFNELFDHLFRTKRIIFMDEIQNVLKVNKSFLFDLQHLIDKHKPVLIVSGSLIRTMKNITEDYKSPLFGRFDMIIKLRELDFMTVSQMCRDLGLDFEDSIKMYSVFGGIPKHYELIEKMKQFNPKDFLLDSFVYYPRPLYEEVRIMLKEEFGKEHRTFFSILSAIAQGSTRLSEIANFVGREQTKITKYLSLLINDFELVRRETPVISGKRGLYKINSNLVEFWFANIWRYQELIERSEEKAMAEKLQKNVNCWFGRKFESVVTELIRKNAVKPAFRFSKIGKQWGKFKGEKGKNTYEIDLVALNEKTKEILFAECKWKDKVNAERILKELKEKAGYVLWNNEKRKEYYAIFAKSFSKRVKEKNVHCFDLKDIEKCLIKKK